MIFLEVPYFLWFALIHIIAKTMVKLHMYIFSNHANYYLIGSHNHFSNTCTLPPIDFTNGHSSKLEFFYKS